MPFIRKVRVLFKTSLIFPRVNGPNKLLKAQNLDIFKNAKCFTRLEPDNVFLFKTIHMPLTQVVIFSSTSNFFATIAALCIYNAMNLILIWYIPGTAKTRIRKCGLGPVFEERYQCTGKSHEG